MKTHHKNSERLVTKIFEDVSKKYDLMNDLMSLGIHRLWKRDFINWLNPQKNTKLIDVASGTGDIAKLFLEQINYDGNVYCVDENKDMLNISKKKLKNKNNIKWFCENAEELPFDNNEFDYYTISFGLRNVENIDKAIRYTASSGADPLGYQSISYDSLDAIKHPPPKEPVCPIVTKESSPEKANPVPLPIRSFPSSILEGVSIN